MAFQHAAAARLNEALQAGEAARGLVGALNAMFAKSFSAPRKSLDV
jgi:hypothetical protein